MLAFYGFLVSPLMSLSLIFCMVVRINSSDCSSPLGLASGEIEDWQLSSSSTISVSKDRNCQPKFGRLHLHNGRAWCSGRKEKGQWFLVDLGVPAKITGTITQGKGDGKQWVTKYQISYSLDAYKWFYVRDMYDQKREFFANVDSFTPRTNFVSPAVYARFLRVHIIAWNNHPSLRLELLGCQECKTHISEGIQVKVKASSQKLWRKRHSCQPFDVALTSKKGWCAKRKNVKQWIQYDLGPPHAITGVITKGRGDTKKRQWIRDYILTYSNDSKIWFTYKDGEHLDEKIFGGNLDKNTERRHYLNHPIKARYVRINPRTWHRAIAMRAAILGCPHSGDCPEGFFKVTEESQCVENMAWSQRTWVNDVRHKWDDWETGKSHLAVDGYVTPTLANCTVVENHNNNQPIWMVHLGGKKEVTGLVIVTWQGEGTEEKSLYTDYVFSLDKLSIYVEMRPRLENIDAGHNTLCATVTRTNNALFQKRIQLDCPHPIKGKYLYIKASGVANRWNPVFSLVLCEVFVY